MVQGLSLCLKNEGDGILLYNLVDTSVSPSHCSHEDGQKTSSEFQRNSILQGDSLTFTHIF